MVSFNHYAFGSVGEFYYTHILGIRPLEPGYRKILITPVPDARLGTVSGSFVSRSGKISVTWEVKEDIFSLQIGTPVETVLRLPDGTKKELGPGSYTFESKLWDLRLCI